MSRAFPSSVPALSVDSVRLLEATCGALLRPIANASFGAEVIGLNLRQRPDPAVLEALQQQMAERGFLVFRGQGVLTPEEQIEASTYFGGQEIHSTHSAHPLSPHRHVFRLSNDAGAGIVGVGPQVYI